MIAFNMETAMIVAREGPEVYFEEIAHLPEDVEELAIRVNDNDRNKTKGEDDLLHEDFCKYIS